MNDLVKIGTQPQEVAKQETVFVDNTGLENIIRMKPSRLTLVHATTLDPQGAKPGQILDVESGAVYDSVDAVLLKTRMTRAYFAEGSVPSKDSEPLCKSYDNVKPIPDAKVKQANFCVSCPKAVWLNGKPAPCKQKLELIVALTSDMMPYYLTVGGKGISPVKQKLGSVFKQAKAASFQGKDTTVQNFVLTFKGVKDGAFHHYDVTKITPISNEEAAPYVSMVDEITAQSNKNAEGDVELVVDEAVGTILDGEIIQEV